MAVSNENLVKFYRENFKPTPVEDNSQQQPNGTTQGEAFGHVTFYGPQSVDSFFTSKYLRFDPKQIGTNNEQIIKLLFEKWQLPRPRLVISVTGGARRFIMHNKILHQFNRSLVILNPIA